MNGRKATLTVCCLLLVVQGARADFSIPPLDALIARADSIVIGEVLDVSAAEGAGAQVAEIDVRWVLAGSPPSSFKLKGSRRDPLLRSFAPGAQLVAFLKADDSGDGFRAPVGGGLGVIVLREETVAATRDLLALVLANADTLTLADVDDELQHSAACGPDTPSHCGASPALVAALLQQLSRGVAVRDAQDVAEIVCEPEAYSPQALAWAVGRAGELRLVEARSCLEELVARRRPGGLAVLAVDALGGLGDAASVQVLRALLPAAAPTRVGESTVSPPSTTEPSFAPGAGPANDPEGSSPPASDLAEQSGIPLQRPNPERKATSTMDPGEGATGLPPRPDDDGAAANPAAHTPVGRAALDDDEPDAESATTTPVNLDPILIETAVLALGRIGDPSVVPQLLRLAQEGNDPDVHFTVVAALGLIGGPSAEKSLSVIGAMHPDVFVRQQAQQARDRLRADSQPQEHQTIKK